MKTKIRITKTVEITHSKSWSKKELKRLVSETNDFIQYDDSDWDLNNVEIKTIEENVEVIK